MSGVIPAAPSSPGQALLAAAPVLVLVVAWAFLYGPVYVDFAAGAWTREENGHAPFIMAISLAAVWSRLRSGDGLALGTRHETIVGFFGLAAALAGYAIGRRAGVEILLSASQIGVAASIVMALFGVKGVRQLWFPLALLFYLIIWPGWALDALTAPLKRLVSETVSVGLFAFGFPVAHAGAVISAGPYELLVADACAGLNSLIALTAVGSVYLYIVRRRSAAVNIAVLAALIPLAVAANMIRVAILVLITYYWGYDAGQSFLHEGAGLLMFAVALAGVFVIDAIAVRLWEPKR